MQNTRILVVGDIMLDRYWFGDVHRISPEAPVPVLHVKKTEDRLGGAANVARNIVALGANVDLLGVVGDDEAGRSIQNLLQKSNINHHLHIDTSISTIVKLRAMGRQQQLLRIDFEEKPQEKILQNKLSRFSSLLPQAELVLFSDYAKGSLVNVQLMIQEAKAQHKKVLLDPKGYDFSIYRGVDILTPNKSELKAVIGSWCDEEDLQRKVDHLRKQFAIQSILLTRSEEGMSLFNDEGVFHVPTQAREVYDVSGAGDTVIATLAVMLAQNHHLKDSVITANRAAGIVVGKLGTATVSHAELFA